jgi:hypothetical protein
LADESFEIFGIFADNLNNLANGMTQVENSGLEAVQLLVSESMVPAIQGVQYVPYMYFVDNQGYEIKIEKVGLSNLEELKELVEQAFELVNN